MRNLFAFLLRHHLILLFIVLMGMSLGMYFSNNSYQHNRLLKATTAFRGHINEQVFSVTQYLHLNQQNKILTKENARLRTFLALQDNTAMQWPADSNPHRMHYIPAKVISNSVNKKYNYLMLDKGRAQGIKPDQGVISSQGVVGIVTHVAENYSSVISLINLNCQISARLKNTREIGRIVWPGNSYHSTELLDIPTHITVNTGDSVITSGYSHIFPENLLIGVVDQVEWQPGDHFYHISLKLAENFNALYHVYAIEIHEADTLRWLNTINEMEER
ncbi:MAG: rod shape-determining protein MreC [Bacteroidia bacterium]|nr:rod shape-determining protein MreC [Bacteroidia bacterium]